VSLVRTHDLDALCDRAATHFPELAVSLDTVRHLTSWATVMRYPDLGEIADPTSGDIDAALDACSRLHDRVSRLCDA
jgi:hypothetical protein